MTRRQSRLTLARTPKLTPMPTRALARTPSLTFTLMLTLALMVPACGGNATLSPATLTVGQEPCRSCRMTISSMQTAAQIAAPGEEALFFDDIGCLRDYLRGHHTLLSHVAIFVADHRTGSWTHARNATYVRAPAQDTPMGSHLLAFADPSSRDRDDAGRRGVPIEAREVFDGIDLPEGAL